MSRQWRISPVTPATMSRQSLGLSFVHSGRRRCLLQEEDHSRSRPHSFPGFPRLYSRMFPEGFRNAYVSVGLRQIRLVQTERPKCGTLSGWNSGRVFSDSAFNLLRNLCDIFLVNSRNGRVSWLAVPRIFLLCFVCNGCQLSFVSQRCHLFEGKMLLSYEDWIISYLLINLRL